MSYTYADRRRTESAVHTETAPQGPSLDALRAGAAKPTAEQMGRRVDLPDAMRAKMEDAFGADLSAVKLYESEAVADAGANAITQGSDIAFAPGMLDFTSYGGQALLGHEISHVVSQQRGEVTGGGFLNDRALEARADREGAMAAAGQQIAMPTAAMSSVTAAPAAGPMQADKAEKEAQAAKDAQALRDSYNQSSEAFYAQRKNTSFRARRKLKNDLKLQVNFQKDLKRGKLSKNDQEIEDSYRDTPGLADRMHKQQAKDADQAADILRMMRAAAWGFHPKSQKDLDRAAAFQAQNEPGFERLDFGHFM